MREFWLIPSLTLKSRDKQLTCWWLCVQLTCQVKASLRIFCWKGLSGKGSLEMWPQYLWFIDKFMNAWLDSEVWIPLVHRSPCLLKHFAVYLAGEDLAITIRNFTICWISTREPMALNLHLMLFEYMFKFEWKEKEKLLGEVWQQNGLSENVVRLNWSFKCLLCSLSLVTRYTAVEWLHFRRNHFHLVSLIQNLYMYKTEHLVTMAGGWLSLFAEHSVSPLITSRISVMPWRSY